MRLIIKAFLFLMITGTAAYGEPVIKSTVDDQTAVEVTVYNSNLGLVKDRREITLPKGRGELRFMDVASAIIPVTVHAKSLNQPKDFSVLEQNYEYDLMNSSKLLDKYVGKQVKLIEWKEYQDRKDIVDAVLLSNNNGQIYKVGNEIYLGHPGCVVLPEIPENLIAKPTLTWLYKNNSEKPHDIEVSYLANNINWKADYILVVDKDVKSSDLSGWVTIDNRSGAAYKDASLKLIAGEIHREGQRLPCETRKYDFEEKLMDSSFEEKSFFEYHIYDLQRKTTLKDNQTKQISLLEANNVGIQKELLVYGIQSYFTSSYRENNPKQPVNVYIKFKNSKENNLGMPLPAGTMRLYKKDTKDSLQFIGEDSIKHTPKDEEIKLKMGEAFDVVAERIQTDYREITTQLCESEWEITLRNHKEQDVVVGIVEPLYGSWSVIQSSHPYTKVDAFTLRFDVAVPKDKEVKVKYRVRVGLQ